MFNNWSLKKRTVSISACAAAGLFLLPAPALAEDAPGFLTQGSADVLWTLIAAILVMFMQAGFGMVESGFTRAKNVGNIMMKNFLDFSAGTVAFFLFGFAFMFGNDLGSFIGSTGFALRGFSDADLTFWFFQSVFAATAATIVSGGMAERTKFGSYIIISIIITALIYPISGHWIWGGGWLAGRGMIDFAGSTVVHSVGGWLALAGAIVLGPRLGKYSPDGKSKAIPGHSLALGGLGVFILWFGWFGFNPGSTVAVIPDIGRIAVTTNLAAAAAMLMAMITAWIRFGKPDISMSMNGALAGLVAITAGCANVSPVGALIIGLGAGVLVVVSIEVLDKVLKIDDPVGAVSVHGVCGAYGTLMVGLFAAPAYGDAGLFYGGGAGLMVTQIIGVAAIFAWAFGLGLVTMYGLKGTVGVRVSKEEELKGLDIAEHGNEAYAGFQIFSTE